MIGRKIVTQYISSGLPKIGDYNSNEEIIFINEACEQKMKKEILPYIYKDLIEQPCTQNHRSRIERWEMLGKIEAATMSILFFFSGGRISNFSEISLRSFHSYYKI